MVSACGLTQCLGDISCFLDFPPSCLDFPVFLGSKRHQPRPGKAPVKQVGFIQFILHCLALLGSIDQVGFMMASCFRSNLHLHLLSMRLFTLCELLTRVIEMVCY